MTPALMAAILALSRGPGPDLPMCRQDDFRKRSFVGGAPWARRTGKSRWKHLRRIRG
jgi:hypothetical protein